MYSHGGSSSSHNFSKGDKIEVRRNVADGDVAVWFPATVLNSPSPNGMLYVKFDTLFEARNGRKRKGRKKSVREYVDVAAGNVRPVPPSEVNGCFEIGEEVEAFHGGEWRRAEVKGIPADLKNTVALGGGGEVVEVDQSRVRVRVCRDCKDDDESGVPPPVPQQAKSTQVESGSKKELKLKIICSPRTSETLTFKEGTPVEVKSDEEGYRGSWYPAFIGKSLGNDKFIVEFQTLTTNGETALLKEEAHASCIRPLPPWIERHERFEKLEQVDAWYNDGWWVGNICEILDEFRYLVYFSTTNEKLQFEHSCLRLHQEWIDQKWFPALKPERKPSDSKAKKLKLKLKNCRKIPDPKFEKGTRVEVKSDEEGYHGSWFSAMVVGTTENGNFIVEYETLKTDDEINPLLETACESYIRPLPPKIHRTDRFKVLEEVDAWFNDGWWVGLISKVLADLKYLVYFWTTNDELIFEHSKIRPHQELINGEWVASFLRPKLHLISKVEKVQIRTVEKTSMTGLLCGLKVEIASGQQGYFSTLYPAIIIRPIRNGKYLVEYRTLKTDNGLELVKENVDASCIRPCPPVIQRVNRFKPNDKVDVWYNNGWWLGQILKIAEGSKYKVCFGTVSDVLEFSHANLRPHQDLIDGRWILAIEDDLFQNSRFCSPTVH